MIRRSSSASSKNSFRTWIHSVISDPASSASSSISSIPVSFLPAYSRSLSLHLLDKIRNIQLLNASSLRSFRIDANASVTASLTASSASLVFRSVYNANRYKIEQNNYLSLENVTHLQNSSKIDQH